MEEMEQEKVETEAADISEEIKQEDIVPEESADTAESETVKEEQPQQAEEKDEAPTEGGALDRLWKAIHAYHRQEVADMIKNHALDIATDEQMEELAAAIIALRDMKLVDLLAKEKKTFTPAMLRLDFDNWNNRDFVRQVLKNCKKSFDLSDDTVCRELFEIACQVGQTDVLSYMVGKRKLTDCYPLLAGGMEDAFHVLRQVKPAELDADMRVEILYTAAQTSDGQERLEKLASLGYNLDETNSDGKMLSDLMQDRINSNVYAKNRAGDRERLHDRGIIQYLEKKRTPEEKEKKPIRWKKVLPIIILVAIFVAVLVFAIVYQIVR